MADGSIPLSVSEKDGQDIGHVAKDLLRYMRKIKEIPIQQLSKEDLSTLAATIYAVVIEAKENISIYERSLQANAILPLYKGLVDDVGEILKEIDMKIIKISVEETRLIDIECPIARDGIFNLYTKSPGHHHTLR